MKVVYTVEQKKKAVATYRKLKSYAATIRQLGYPSRHVLFDWVRESGSIGRPKKHAYTPPKRYPWTTKLEAVEAVMSGRNVKDVAEENGMTSHAVLYEWVRIYRRKGQVGLMSRKEQIEAGIYKTKAQLKKEPPDDPEELKELEARLMAEKAMLEQELEMAKKCPGRIPEKLRPKAKAAIVDSLKARLPLGLFLEVAGLPRSSYYYASLAAKRPDKYAHVRAVIREISEASMHTYGSPRIRLSLRRRDVLVSEKVVRRLMKEEGVEVRYAKRKRRYSSYIGEITPAVDDLVKRRFKAESPNELWLTDITDFSAADGKLYLVSATVKLTISTNAD